MNPICFCPYPVPLYQIQLHTLPTTESLTPQMDPVLPFCQILLAGWGEMASRPPGRMMNKASFEFNSFGSLNLLTYCWPSLDVLHSSPSSDFVLHNFVLFCRLDVYAVFVHLLFDNVMRKFKYINKEEKRITEQ